MIYFTPILFDCYSTDAGFTDSHPIHSSRQSRRYGNIFRIPVGPWSSSQGKPLQLIVLPTDILPNNELAEILLLIKALFTILVFRKNKLKRTYMDCFSSSLHFQTLQEWFGRYLSHIQQFPFLNIWLFLKKKS